MNSSAESAFERWRGPVSLYLGPLLFIICALFDPLNSRTMSLQLGLVLFVLTWWVGEPVPLGVTSLLIPVIATLTGLAGVKEAFRHFAHPLIFLFLGSFILAEGIVHHHVDRFLAVRLLRIRILRQSPLMAIFAFGFVTWFLSMWISNTAATAMMIPLSYTILRNYAEDPTTAGVATGGVLFIAYSASVGGIATPVGTPPNLVTLGFLDELANIKISFFEWMGLILPISLFLLFGIFGVIYVLFLKNLLKDSSSSITLPEGEESLSTAKISVLTAFGITVSLWIIPGALSLTLGKSHALSRWLSAHLPESVVAVIGASLLFILPDKLRPYRPVLSWKEAGNIDWNTLLLFGGGLTLGDLTIKTGLGKLLGHFMLGFLKSSGLLLTTALSHIMGVTLTEFMSNTATSNLVIPVIIAVLKEAHLPVLLPVLTACLATSLAFLLPVSTPPNAIAYASGYVKIKDMIKAGFFSDLVGFVIIIAYMLTLYHMGAFH